MTDQLSACIDVCPSTAIEQHRAHQARLKRIASRAIEQHQASQRPPEIVLADPVSVCVLRLEENIRAANAAIQRLRAIRVDVIQAEVASAFGLGRREIMGGDRRASYVRPRHIAMYLASQLTGHHLKEIGRRFGGRDHTTVLHAIRKITALVANNQDVAADIYCSDVVTHHLETYTLDRIAEDLMHRGKWRVTYRAIGYPEDVCDAVERT